MHTDNAYTATLIWLVTGIAAALLAGLVVLAETSRERDRLSRPEQVQADFPQLMPLGAQSLAAR